MASGLVPKIVITFHFLRNDLAPPSHYFVPNKRSPASPKPGII